jgi:dTDP-4-dehydrorhamnose 3,5-epimerase
MKTIKTNIEGLSITEPDVIDDGRGWFSESYSKKKLKELGIEADFVQDNRSFSAKKGTLRGLHFQNQPFAQAKLVSCLRGAVLDVAVDLRNGSPTYGRWFGVELSADNKRQLFIPRGFAHGFLTLTDDVEFFYKVDNYYDKQYDRGIAFNDPDIAVDWGVSNPILSDKDRANPFLKHSDVDF